MGVGARGVDRVVVVGEEVAIFIVLALQLYEIHLLAVVLEVPRVEVEVESGSYQMRVV